jgi:hypothetical protein
MERHKEYMDGFMTALGEKLETETATFALNVYDAISPYIVTDCSGTTLKNLMEDYGSYPIEEIVSPEGENVRGEEYYEFYVDEDALDTLILRLFYAPK